MLFKVCLNSVPVHRDGGHAYVACKLHLVVSGMHLSGVLLQSCALDTPEMRIQCLSSDFHMCPPCVKVQSDLEAALCCVVNYASKQLMQHGSSSRVE
jgi:hypothetical protein